MSSRVKSLPRLYSSATPAGTVHGVRSKSTPRIIRPKRRPTCCRTADNSQQTTTRVYSFYTVGSFASRASPTNTPSTKTKPNLTTTKKTGVPHRELQKHDETHAQQQTAYTTPPRHALALQDTI